MGSPWCMTQSNSSGSCCWKKRRSTLVDSGSVPSMPNCLASMTAGQPYQSVEVRAVSGGPAVVCASSDLRPPHSLLTMKSCRATEDLKLQTDTNETPCHARLIPAFLTGQ